MLNHELLPQFASKGLRPSWGTDSNLSPLRLISADSDHVTPFGEQHELITEGKQ